MRKTKLIITITSILLAALMLTGCKWGGKKTPPTPDYPEPPAESNAETYVETGVETEAPKLDRVNGGGAVGLTYTTDVTVNISTGTVSLYFANPSRSVDNISVKLYVDGFKIAESGILEPGTQLSTLSLTDAGVRTMKNIGVYDGKFVVDFYNSESNEKSVLSTEIPITAMVRQ